MTQPVVVFHPGKGKNRFYTVNGVKVPSVTTVLGATVDKGGALSWWAQTMTLENISELSKRSIGVPLGNPVAMLEKLKAEKLTVNHRRESAADRGSAIHRAAELWAQEQVVPNPDDYPEEYRGYIKALVGFLVAHRPEFLATEAVVGSAEYGYAGTYDARLRIDDRVGIVDYKTSKGVYTDHHVQLAAYELAAVECGAEPTDFQAVIHLGADGNWDVEKCVASPNQFLSALAWYCALGEVEELRRKK